MTSADRFIGTAPCPLCGAPARVSVSKKLLSVLTCPTPLEGGCSIQLFARHNRSDQLIRDRVAAAPVPANDPEPPPAPAKKSRGWFGFGDD